MSDRLTVITGDCVEEMRKLPAESVHLVVTSPPYWGLRDYKIPPSIWGGDPDCEHAEWGEVITVHATNHVDKRRWNHARNGRGEDQPVEKRPGWKRQHIAQGQFCQQCGAWRGVFGLEPTPELYLEHTLIIFREVWRVLRKDGTLWINLGDSYATGAGSARSPGGNCFGKQNAVVDSGNFPRSQANRMPIVGLKPGDLVVIPWRVALALQSDGWYLRRDNIWFKPNPMPESVNGWRWEKHRIKVGRSDRVPSHQKSSVTSSVPQSVGLTRAGREGRANIEAPTIECPGCAKCEPNGGLILRKGNWRCTTSHEYVFQFSKSDSYFCDAEAARERSTGRPSGNKKRFIAKKDGERGRINNHLASCVPWAGATNRNRRSVWPIATAPFKDAHFATFPPALVRPIIQAASPVKCCSECGAAWAPIVERGQPNRAQQRACGGDQNGEYRGTATKDFIDAGAEDASAVKARILAGMVTKTVIGYRPTCDHAATGIPAMVLDPFGGSGTVAQVSLEEGRAAVVIELSREYLPMIHKRCAVTHGLAL